MKRSILFLAAMLTIAISLTSLKARANDGDWVEGNIAQWWWKYVRVGDGSVKALLPAVQIAEIRSAKAGYKAFSVTYYLKNNTNSVYKGGEKYEVGYDIMDPSPNPWKPQVIDRGLTAALKPGEMSRISIVVYTPDKSTFDNGIQLVVQ